MLNVLKVRQTRKHRLTGLFERDEGRCFDEVLVEEGAEFGRIMVDVWEDEGAAERVHHLILLAIGASRSTRPRSRGTSALFDAIEHKVMSDAHNVNVVHCVRHSPLQPLLQVT